MESKIFLISHGDFAKGLHNTLEMIAGHQENLFSFGLKGDVTTKIIVEEIKKEIKTGDFAIILGDLAGGSVCNEAMSLLSNKSCMLVGGINLPLLIELVLSKASTPEEVKNAIENSRLEIKQIEIPAICEGDDLSEFLG
jgi:mannose/fructose-specific phosphotransferase system component IIA